MMVKKKKRVPDWLNNTIWSSSSSITKSSPPQSPKSSSYDVTVTTKSSSVTSFDNSSDHFLPLPQPPPKLRVSSITSEDDNNDYVEDVTRQSLLLQKILKSNFSIVHDMLLDTDTSGFSFKWDLETCCVDIEDKVWTDYCKTHKGSRAIDLGDDDVVLETPMSPIDVDIESPMPTGSNKRKRNKSINLTAHERIRGMYAIGRDASKARIFLRGLEEDKIIYIQMLEDGSLN
ncbi:hypothetical protein Tco_0328080 [Tanacetum coccineum]